MAKLSVMIDVPGWTGDQLRQAVVDIDAADDPVPIVRENVDVLDILTLILSGELGVTYETVADLIIDY